MRIRVARNAYARWPRRQCPGRDGRHTLSVHHKAAWTSDGIVNFGYRDNPKMLTAWSGIRLGYKTVKATPSVDFARWLGDEFGSCMGRRDGGCLVVVKMDVEEAEYALVDALLRSRARCVVDELFVEVHWNRWQQTSEKRKEREHTWDDAVGLVRALRGAGVFTHLWH